MKSVLLVLATNAAYMIVITAVFRAIIVRRRIALMCSLFLAALVVFIVVYLMTPPDLGFLPLNLTASTKWIDLGFGMLLYIATFFGGILQLYNLADRGFSLRMLIDIYEAPGGVLTTDEMFRQYSCGRGLVWMYQKRLDGLLDQRLIVIVDQVVRNSKRGHRVALLYEWVQAFLRLRSGPY